MLKLSAQSRQETGRVVNQKLREKNLVPAVLYGDKVENLNLSVKASEIKKIYSEAGESTLIKLSIGKEDRVVLIKDVARNAVSGDIIHVDFNQIRMDKEISVEIPLVFVGESEAVKQDGGILVKSIQSVEISALPQDLLHEIKVDISSLKTFDDKISVSDLNVPSGVKIEAEGDITVASVMPPRSEEELKEMEETPVESVENIEVEKAQPEEESNIEE